MEHNITKVHQLGPRVVLELLLELGAEQDMVPAIADKLASYATLSPETVRVTGGDKVPPRRLVVVP